MHEQGKFTEGGAVPALDDGSCAKIQFFAVSNVVEGGSGFTYDVADQKRIIYGEKCAVSDRLQDAFLECDQTIQKSQRAPVDR